MNGRTLTGRELDAVELLRTIIGEPPADEVWVGDDAAVVVADGTRLLFASDVNVEGVHFDRRFVPLADVGWRALVQNLSDIAAMGGTPTAAVVSVAGAREDELPAIYSGLLDAGRTYGCRIVGGDLSDGPALVIAIAILGTVAPTGPVRRSGAHAGDSVFVTGELGAAAAGLALLRRDPESRGDAVEAFLHPKARIYEGAVAARAGANAMIDVSDGLGIDLHRLADASEVGMMLDDVPVATGASLEDALGGGEDYELAFTASDVARVESEFAKSALRAPLHIGSIVEERRTRLLRGKPFEPLGFEHQL